MAKSITLSTAISVVVIPRKPRPQCDFTPVEFGEEAKVMKRTVLADGGYNVRIRKILVARKT